MRNLLLIFLLFIVVLPMNGKNKERITERGSSLFYRSWRYPVVKEHERDTVEKMITPKDSVAVVDSLPQDSVPSVEGAPLDSLPADALTQLDDALNPNGGQPNKAGDGLDDGAGLSDNGRGDGDGENGKGGAPTASAVARPDINTCIVYFIFDQSNFIADYTAEFDTIMAFIDYHKGKDFEVVGHTDERGTVAYNQGLSERRAKKVYDVLVRRGVDPKRLTMIGRSELELAIPHAKNEKEHLLNRRVVVRVKRE